MRGDNEARRNRYRIALAALCSSSGSATLPSAVLKETMPPASVSQTSPGTRLNMRRVPWLRKRLVSEYGATPRLWGLHNYSEAVGVRVVVQTPEARRRSVEGGAEASQPARKVAAVQHIGGGDDARRADV